MRQVRQLLVGGIAGTVEMVIQGQPTLTLHAGDRFLMPPRSPHNAFDVGPKTGQMLSTYIVEVGQPLATFTVDGPPLPPATHLRRGRDDTCGAKAVGSSYGPLGGLSATPTAPG